MSNALSNIIAPGKLLEIAPPLLKAQLPLFIKGPVGVGKSAILRKIADEHFDGGFYDIRMAQMDPTDIKGFPAPDAKKKVMEWLKPYFLAMDPKSRGILFFDELTSAPTAVQAAAYEIILDRKVGEHKIPDGWSVVAAGNRSKDRAIVNRMSAALKNRFIHLEVEPDLDSFVAYASAAGLNWLIPAFLRFKPDMLHTFDPAVEGDAFATPRTWEYASRVMELAEAGELSSRALQTALSGTIGLAEASAFASYVAEQAHLPSIEEIVSNPKTAPIPENPGQLYAVTSLVNAETKDISSFRAIMQYLERMPIEYQALYFSDLQSKTDVFAKVKTTKEWAAWGIANHSIIV